MFPRNSFVGQYFDGLQAREVSDLDILCSAGKVCQSDPLSDSVLPADDAALNVGVTLHFCVSQDCGVHNLCACSDVAISANYHIRPEDRSWLNYSSRVNNDIVT